MTADPGHFSRKPSWISTPLSHPGHMTSEGVMGQGEGWVQGRTPPHQRRKVVPWHVLCTHSAPFPRPRQVCSWPPPPAPSLTLNWRRTLAISYSRCSSMPRWRHHLRELLLRSDFTWCKSETRASRPVQLGEEEGADPLPRRPQRGPKQQPPGRIRGRWRSITAPSGTPALLLLPCLSSSAPSCRKPSQATPGQT